MINIVKNTKEPPLLHKYRISPGATYDNAPKGMITELLHSLVDEQYALCCYCQQRINVDTASVEHILSRHNHPDLALVYSNMAAVCSCTEGQPKVRQHCDDYKGSKDFTFDLSSIEELISYKTSGIISSDNLQLDAQLGKDVLNLNNEYLKANRKSVYQAYQQFMSKNPTFGEISQKIKEWESPYKGQKREFCGVMLYFLKKRLMRMKK